MDLPVDFQNVSSSGFQSAIQVEVRFLISMFLSGWRWRWWRGQFRCGLTERRKKAPPPGARKRLSRAAALPVASCAKTATPPALAAPRVALYKLRANPQAAGQNLRKSTG